MHDRSAEARSLSIRTKILLALVASLLVFCVAIFAASFFVIQSGFAKIEQDAMRKDLSRLSDQLQNAVHQELVSLNDWSTWDESYRFAKHPTKDFTDTNLRDSGLANLDIEVVAYFDTNGTPIFAKEISHASGSGVPDEATLAVLTADPRIAKRESETDTLGGFVQVPNGILQFGSRPLLQSSGEGPSTGSLLFARYLDDARIQTLADVLHLSITAYPYDAAELPSDIVSAKARFSAGDQSYVVALSGSQIAGYTELRDIHEKPILIFRVVEARPIHTQGNLSIVTFYTVGGAALILFGLFMILLLDRLVIARFIRLTSGVEKINDGRDLSIRVEGGERDEIGVLAERINQLLAWLTEAREAEAASRRETVNLLDELKKEKEQREEMSRLLASKGNS